MTVNMKIFFNLLLFILNLVNSSRILVINPTPSYSHQIVIHPIVKQLAERGHDIVFATTHPIGNKSLTNVKEIDLGVQTSFRELVCSSKPSLFNKAFEVLELFVDMTDTQLNHPSMQDLIRNKSEHFDLVMIEYFAPTMYVFKERFNCPFIGFLSLSAQNSDHKNFGNFDNPALYPDALIFKGMENSFMQRIQNVFLSVIFELHREYILYPRANEIIRSHFGKMYPYIGKIAGDVDMLLVTTNIMLSDVRPVTPATIMIGGGIHIREAKELPRHLQTFLDNSKRGTVYISFGSNVQSSTLSHHVIHLFLKTFSELPYDFLWKFEEDLPNIPDNVLIMKWVPQQDVLRHRNIKVFITQAGLQSCDEALYNEIPMLAIPFFVDQFYNAHKIVQKKIGLMIKDVTVSTCDQLKCTLLELLNNSTYTENVRKLGRIIKDEPMKPIQKAIWWTEYVLRHKGSKHLKGPIVPFYQRYLFDVFAFFISLLMLLALCIFKFVNYVICVWKARSYITSKKSK